jgi:hypothetical protein
LKRYTNWIYAFYPVYLDIWERKRSFLFLDTGTWAPSVISIYPPSWRTNFLT